MNIHAEMFIYLCVFQQQLEEEAAKPPEEKASSPEVSSSEPKCQNIIQIIYAENRVSLIALPMLRLLSCKACEAQRYKKKIENHLNPVMLVVIG